MNRSDCSPDAALRRSWRRLAVFIVLVTAGAWLITYVNSRRVSIPADASTLRQDFNRDASKAAILAFLQPDDAAPFTSLFSILAKAPRAGVRVFVVWKTPPPSVPAIPDPRVRQYVDMDGAVTASAAPVLGIESTIAWYPPGSAWSHTFPLPEINIPARGADLRPIAARLAALP